MHDSTPLDSELDRLAAQLAALSPRAQWQRDRLMFAAGRASAGHRLRIVNCVLAATSLALAGVAVAVPLALERRADGVAQVPEPTPSAVREVADAASNDLREHRNMAEGPTYFRLRQTLPGGTEVLRPPSMNAPAATPAEIDRTPPASSRGLLRRYLQAT